MWREVIVSWGGAQKIVNPSNSRAEQSTAAIFAAARFHTVLAAGALSNQNRESRSCDISNSWKCCLKGFPSVWQG